MSQGIKALLKPHYYTVGIVNDGRELLSTIAKTKPEVILLDLSMPHINGLELIPQIIAGAPNVRVLVVTMHVDRALADLAISSGAHGFIPKESSAEELNAAIDHVLSSSKPFISSRVPKRSFRDGAAVEHPALDRLTPRHRQILGLIGAGKDTQDIADTLGVSPRTVEFHRAGIRKALGITTEWGLMRFAIMLGEYGSPDASSGGRGEESEGPPATL